MTISCKGAELIGIVHEGASEANRGVLIVVGGPQYRVGSHRQFLLLARALAAAGIPVMRFDYRGMGDAGGEPVAFDDIDADIAAALDAFFGYCPGLREAVIWGLCDAASAALFYAWRDSRVAGLVLLNPWVRTEAGEARAYLKHYYWIRFFNPEPWRKMLRGEFEFVAATGFLLRMLAKTLDRAKSQLGNNFRRFSGKERSECRSLPERMAKGLERFSGPVLLILSGNDLTAAEFKDTIQISKTWRRLMSESRLSRRDLPEATHTFSRREWRDQVAAWTVQWLRSW